jgi:hypothetical protein
MNLGRHKRAGQPKPGGTAKTPPRFGSGFSATKNRCSFFGSDLVAVPWLKTAKNG